MTSDEHVPPAPLPADGRARAQLAADLAQWWDSLTLPQRVTVHQRALPPARHLAIMAAYHRAAQRRRQRALWRRAHIDINARATVVDLARKPRP